MSFHLHIKKDGQKRQTLELSPGTYTLGRKDSCDIVIKDKNISSKHAKLTVGKNSVCVKDTKSTNGVFSGGKKIKKKNFSSDFELEIKPFTVQGRFSGTVPQLNTKPPFAANINVRVAQYTTMVLLVILMALFFYIPLQSSLKSSRNRELLKRGVLLTRYQAEINIQPLSNKRIELARVAPVTAEEGVVYAFVVDSYGKVLAPQKEVGKFLKMAELTEALEKKELTSWRGANKERVLFAPIKDVDVFLGGVVVGYDVGRAASAMPSLGAKAFGLFLVGVVLAVLLGTIVLRAFLYPLRRLAEEVGMCVKEGRDQVNFEGSCDEIDTLAETFNRVLLLTRREREKSQGQSEAPLDSTRAVPESETPDIAPQQTISEPQPVQAVDEPEDLYATNTSMNVRTTTTAPAVDPKQAQPAHTVEETSPPVEEQLTPNKAPQVDCDIQNMSIAACVIDCEQYSILEINEPFSRLFSDAGPRTGAHVLEIFTDPDMITAISALIDNSENQSESQLEGARPMSIHKQVLSDSSIRALFTFEEK